MTRCLPFAIRILIVSLLALAMSLLVIHRAPAASAQGRQLESSGRVADPVISGYVREWVDGKARCRPANPAETRFLMRHDPELPLREIARGGLSLQAVGAVDIILRGTPRSRTFPRPKRPSSGEERRWRRYCKRLNRSRLFSMSISGRTFSEKRGRIYF